MEKIYYVENDIGIQAIKKITLSKTCVLDDLKPTLDTTINLLETWSIHFFYSNSVLFSKSNSQFLEVSSSEKQDVILVKTKPFGPIGLINKIKVSLQ